MSQTYSWQIAAYLEWAIIKNMQHQQWLYWEKQLGLHIYLGVLLYKLWLWDLILKKDVYYDLIAIAQTVENIMLCPDYTFFLDQTYICMYLSLSLSLYIYIYIWELNFAITVISNVLAPNSARPSAGTVLTTSSVTLVLNWPTLLLVILILRILNHCYWDNDIIKKSSRNLEAFAVLTHWGRMYIHQYNRPPLVQKMAGWLRFHAIIWIKAGILSIGPLWTNFSEILFTIQTFSLKNMHLKMSSVKWQLFCLVSIYDDKTHTYSWQIVTILWRCHNDIQHQQWLQWKSTYICINILVFSKTITLYCSQRFPLFPWTR